MRLRDLFRSYERKSTSSIVPVLDSSTFIHAASEKDTDALQKYLLAGYPPDQIDSINKTSALHTAVESNNLRGVQLLIQAGAQINLTDATLSTPLHVAASFGFEEIVDLLLNNGANMFLQDANGRNPFHLAVTTGNNRLVQLFLSMADTEMKILHATDAQNWTPLMCACASNLPSMCSFLVSHGAHLCACNDRGLNVFHLVAFLGSLSVAQELLQSSIDEETLIKALNQGDYRNQTPLFYACAEGHTEIALILLNAGANAYHLDNDRQTCLHAMLSSSIILKRHLRLFYRFIEILDYRTFEDNLARTLLDLASVNQLATLCSLLNLYRYPRHYQIISANGSSPYSTTPLLLSLRHQCVMKIKRSLTDVPSRSKPWTMRQIFNSSIDQLFQLNNKTVDRSSIDQIEKKFPSKSRKSSSSIDNESMSIVTTNFKREQIDSMHNDHSINSCHHPMRELAWLLVNNPARVDDLFDFPSLNNHPALEEDLKTTMITYNLDRTETSNQI